MTDNNRKFIVNKLDGNTSEMFIYSDIGTYENCISANDFMKELRILEQQSSKINLRINCNGGDVYQGIAIFNAVKSSSCVITGYIDGIAASMASLIAMACSKVYMSKYARLMTHLPSGGAWGNASNLRIIADELDALTVTAIKMYQEKTGLTETEVKSKFLNGSDNYFSADQAIAEKLIDGIFDGEQVQISNNITDTKALWGAYNNKLQVKLSGNCSESQILLIGDDDPKVFSNDAELQMFLRDKAKNTPLLQDTDTANDQLHEWVNEETNYADLSHDLRNVLFEHDRGLYGALFWCEYGKYPPRMERPDINKTDEIIKNIKNKQLPVLRMRSYDELRKTGKLNRLKNLDILAYNKKLEMDDDDISEDRKEWNESQLNRK